MYVAQVDIATVTLSAVIAFGTSVGVAFLSATALETQRQRRVHETEKTVLRDAVYTEIVWKVRDIAADIKRAMKDSPLSLKIVKEILSKNMSCPVYDATRNIPALFYQLDDARAIDGFYGKLRMLSGRAEELFNAFHEHPFTEEWDEEAAIRGIVEEIFPLDLGIELLMLDMKRLEEINDNVEKYRSKLPQRFVKPPILSKLYDLTNEKAR